MPTGRVKFFWRDKGYGFVIEDGGRQETFFHVTDVRFPESELRTGVRLRYRKLSVTFNGIPRAVDITRRDRREKLVRECD